VENPKYKYRNPKQIQITKFLMLKTQKPSIQTRHVQVVMKVFSERSRSSAAEMFNFWNFNFDIVSNFWQKIDQDSHTGDSPRRLEFGF